MKNLNEFKELIESESYTEALKFLNDEYFGGDTSYQLIAKEIEDEERAFHAKTGGRGEGKCRITFSVDYLDRVLDEEKNDEEVFAKIISTFRHERVHVEQRKDEVYMDSSTKEEREFMAYSEELFPCECLPALSDAFWLDAYNKAERNYNAMSSPSETLQARKAAVDKIKAKKGLA